MISTTKVHENLSLDNLPNEIWKDIPEYEGLYQASNLGRIKSLERIVKSKGNSTQKVSSKILKQSKDTNGYLRVVLYFSGKPKTLQTHIIIFKTFKKRILNLVIDHDNNIRTDNRLENLKQITQRKNTSKDKKGYTSKYIGVSWYKKLNKWRSMIRINGKQTHIGYFENEIDAYYSYVNKLNEIGGL